MVEALQGIRSIFKARKLVYQPHHAHLLRDAQTSTPVPLDIAVLREALRSDNPTRAALAFGCVSAGYRGLQRCAA